LPYGSHTKESKEFSFEEAVDAKGQEGFAWMNACWAYAACVADAYARYGWLAATQGVSGGGKVADLPAVPLPTGDGDTDMIGPTEVPLSDRRAEELSALGFLPLVNGSRLSFAAFAGSQSCYRPAAAAGSDLSARLNYLMCAARSAHALQVLTRYRLGAASTPADCGRWLNEGLADYVLPDLPLAATKAMLAVPVCGRPPRAADLDR
jgi:type VI secretion system protein ImpC